MLFVWFLAGRKWVLLWVSRCDSVRATSHLLVKLKNQIGTERTFGIDGVHDVRLATFCHSVKSENRTATANPLGTFSRQDSHLLSFLIVPLSKQLRTNC